MKSYTLITTMLVIFLWPMTGQSAQTQEGYSANARYRYSSKHHHKAARRTHPERRNRNDVYDPDRTVRHAVAQDDEFTTKKAPVTFPFTTGTSILNRYGRWYQGVGSNSCVNPWDDLRFLLILDTFAAY